MKREYIVTMEVAQLVRIPVLAGDEIEAEALAEYELEMEMGSEARWSVYDIEETDNG